MDLKPYGGNNTLEITIKSIKMIVGYNCLLISYFFLQKKKNPNGIFKNKK